MAQQTITKTNLKPLGNRVLVKRLETEETTKGGIILPDSAKKQQETATVIDIGPGKRLDDGTILPPSVKKGDKVLVGKYSGQEVTIDDETFSVVDSDDIIAILIEE